MKRLNKFALFLFVILNPYESRAISLSTQDIVNNVLKNYPLIKSSREEVDSYNSKVTEFKGFYDSKLKFKLKDNQMGYYQNDQFDALVEKPIMPFGSEIYAGYRVGRGDFPIYDEKIRTQDNGEIRAGFSFSLLRNRSFDEPRYLIDSSKLALINSDLKLLENKNKAVRDALKKYWSLYVNNHIHKVYKDILEISLTRDKGLEFRVKKGDLAEIYRKENEQYIYKRQADVVTADRYLKKSIIDFSLYYRDINGEPILLSYDSIPFQFPTLEEVTNEIHVENIKRSLDKRPELKRMNAHLEQTNLDVKLGENKLIPLLDFGLELSRDYGAEIKAKRNTEGLVLVSLEIPLEMNSGKGKIESANANRRSLQHNLKLIQDQITAEINQNYISLKAAKEKFMLSSKEAEVARVLAKAEASKWDKGASSFFTVNIREQYLADALVKEAESFYQYQEAMADYKASVFDFVLD